MWGNGLSCTPVIFADTQSVVNVKQIQPSEISQLQASALKIVENAGIDVQMESLRQRRTSA